MAAKKLSEARAIVRHAEELYQEGLAVASRYREIAAVNESFVHGNQWAAFNTANGRIKVERDAWWKDVPRFYVNETAPLLMTWSSLLTKDLPTVRAIAATDEPEDTYKAEIGGQIIRFLEQELNTADKTHKAAHFAGMHGTGGLKICFDPSTDKVSWSRLTVFDFVIDPTNADWHDARWVIFEDHASEDEAIEAFERNGIRREPRKTAYKNAVGDELHGVPRRELWQRPCAKYKTGLYACIIDGELVEASYEYPYVFADDSGKPQYPLPLVLMRVRDIRDSVYGGTNLTDVVPLQRGFNETVSRIQKMVRVGSNMHLKVPDDIAGDDFDMTENALIRFKSSKAAAAREIGWTQPGEPPRTLFEQRDFFRGAMQSVIGLNEVTLGSQTRSLSGRAIENIVELDAQKNADASKELRVMIRDAWELTWRLVGRFYTDVRKAKMGNADVNDVLAFNAADVAGVDVRLEPSSETDKLEPVATMAAKERADAGVGSQIDIDKAKNSPSVGLSRMHAERLISDVLSGAMVDIESVDDINPDVLAEVIQKHKARALAKQDRALWIRLENLRRELQSMVSRANEVAPQDGEEPMQ